MKTTAHIRFKRRQERVRSRIRGTEQRPRLTVKRSLSHIHAQIIDDSKGRTLVGLSDSKLKLKGTKSERAGALGKALAEMAKEKGIVKIIFDRSGYKYHGRVRALAEALRAGGLEF